MNDATTLWTEKSQPDLITETLQSKLGTAYALLNLLSRAVARRTSPKVKLH
jgi:hypothetical protein